MLQINDQQTVTVSYCPFQSSRLYRRPVVQCRVVVLTPEVSLVCGPLCCKQPHLLGSTWGRESQTAAVAVWCYRYWVFDHYLDACIESIVVLLYYVAVTDTYVKNYVSHQTECEIVGDTKGGWHASVPPQSNYESKFFFLPVCAHHFSCY